MVAGGNIESVSLVPAVGLQLAHIQRQTARPQTRTSQGQCHHGGQRQPPHVLHTANKDGVGHNQVLHFANVAFDQRELFTNHVDRVVQQVIGYAAGSHIGVVHAQAGDVFKNPQDFFTTPEAGGQHGRCAQFVRAGTDGDQVRSNPVQLHQQHPDFVDPPRHLIRYAQSFFDRQAPGDFRKERRHVVHAGAVGHALVVSAVFHGFFNTGVQVASTQTAILNGFAFQLHDDAQHAVGGGVHRAQVDSNPVIVSRLEVRSHRGPFAVLNGKLRHSRHVVASSRRGMNILCFCLWVHSFGTQL